MPRMQNVGVDGVTGKIMEEAVCPEYYRYKARCKESQRRIIWFLKEFEASISADCFARASVVLDKFGSPSRI